MKKKGVKYVTMVRAVSETSKLLRDMKTQGVDPEVVDLGNRPLRPGAADRTGLGGRLRPVEHRALRGGQVLPGAAGVPGAVRRVERQGRRAPDLARRPVPFLCR